MALLLAFICAPFALLAVAWALRAGKGTWTRRLLWLPLAFEGCLVCADYNYTHYFDGIDLNPEIAAADIAGTWIKGDERITFAQDEKFVTNRGTHGSWSISGALIAEEADGSGWHALKEAETLFLLHEQDGDPDGWNIHARFLKMKASYRPQTK